MLSQRKLFSLLLLALALTFTFAQDVEINLEDPFQDEEIEGELGGFTIQNIQDIQGGFPNITESWQVPEDSYIVPALQVGAQYVASQAVADGLFTSSFANVTQVYTAEVTNPTDEVLENPTGNIYNDGTVYNFDVEVVSAAGESLRAQVVVIVDLNTVSYKVTYYNFDYLVNYEGEIDAVEVGFGNNNFEYNLLDWNNSTETELDLDVENIVNVEGLPEFGESFEYDPNLLVNNWVQVNVTERINNDDFLYLIKYGSEFVIEQGSFNENLIMNAPNQYSINYVHSVYERNSTNGTDFKFEVDARSQEYQTVRLNFQLGYNANASSLNLYSWGIDSIINVAFN